MEPLTMVGLVFAGIIVLWIALNYLWNRQWRPRQLAKRVPTATFNSILGRLLKLIFREDKFPSEKLMKKNPKLAKFVVWRNFYLVSFVAGAATIALGYVENGLYLLGTLMVVIAIRARKVFYSRYRVTQRMFAVAASEFKYPKDADLNPWRWVNVRKWESLVIPGSTIVSYPPAFKAEDIRNRENFERHFNGTVTDDNTWIYKWKSSQSIVQCEPMSHIPTMANYPGSRNRKWHEIPLGPTADGEVVWDLTQTPMSLICGSTGGGKSVMQRNIIFHCIQHKDRFRFLGVDVKRVELKPYAKYDDVVMGIGTNLEDGVEICRYARDEMMRRYEEMEELGVNHFMDLDDPPFALMLMIDEAYMFLAPEGVKTDEGKARDELHGEATTILGEIARLGRAAGVHMVMATQRPDASVIKGELKANLAFRVAAGRMGTTPSLMVLDTDAATRLPGEIKGRSIVSINGEEQMFQGYFAKQDWIDHWLASNNPGNNDLDADGIQDEIAEEAKVAIPQDDKASKSEKGLLARIKKYNADKAAEGTEATVKSTGPTALPEMSEESIVNESAQPQAEYENTDHEDIRDLVSTFDEDYPVEHQEPEEEFDFPANSTNESNNESFNIDEFDAELEDSFTHVEVPSSATQHAEPEDVFSFQEDDESIPDVAEEDIFSSHTEVTTTPQPIPTPTQKTRKETSETVKTIRPVAVTPRSSSGAAAPKRPTMPARPKMPPRPSMPSPSTNK